MCGKRKIEEIRERNYADDDFRLEVRFKTKNQVEERRRLLKTGKEW